jgi:hypothetical protein
MKTTKFNDLITSLLLEASNPPPKAPSTESNKGGDDENEGDANAAQDDANIGGEDALDEFNADDVDLDDLEEEPVEPEELELAKMAIRALYFNPDSKSVHRFVLKIGDRRIPFEKISDYFEETKNWKPVLGFIEHIMDKFEGMGSKWTEQPEIRGKGILDKIKLFNQDAPLEEHLDNGKRIYWVRIILNALLYGKPTYNLNTADVNEKNIKEIYRKLKQDFGRDSRGLWPNNDLRAPGNF